MLLDSGLGFKDGFATSGERSGGRTKSLSIGPSNEMRVYRNGPRSSSDDPKTHSYLSNFEGPCVPSHCFCCNFAWPPSRRLAALVVTIRIHNSAKNFINEGLSRHLLFLRSGLNFTSCFRKRSGGIDKYRSVEPSPPWPRYAESAGSMRFISARCLNQAVSRWTAKVARRSCMRG